MTPPPTLLPSLPTPSLLSLLLHLRYLPTTNRPLVAHNWYITCYLFILISLAIQANNISALIVADIISSKAPPLPKEVAEDIPNKNKNKLIRTAITTARANPVLATIMENIFIAALKMVKSNVSYKTALHCHCILTL
ncbi:hypothetical protein F5146DRAFT_1002192 [Armillaria mellea]|nr:hypothetical protein F5146DRAFT_1002192 [Armillaria mellea]